MLWLMLTHITCSPVQMMIGLCGAELVRPDSVGASQGFLGWVAYLGEWDHSTCKHRCQPRSPVVTLAAPLNIHQSFRPTRTAPAGAANAGIPLSIIVKDFGWNTYFMTLLAACGVAVLLLAPMTNAKSYIQVQAEKKAAASLKAV